MYISELVQLLRLSQTQAPHIGTAHLSTFAMANNNNNPPVYLGDLDLKDIPEPITDPLKSPISTLDAVDENAYIGETQDPSRGKYGDDEDPADTPLKDAAQTFLEAYQWRDLAKEEITDTQASMWQVSVDPEFLPEENLCAVCPEGIIYGVDIRYSAIRPWGMNQYKLYVLLCLKQEVGILRIKAIEPDRWHEKKRQTTGWDDHWQVDLACEFPLFSC